MIRFKNKRTLISLLMVLILGLGVVSYYATLSYQKYMTVQKSSRFPFLFSEITSVLNKLESERITSTTYLVTQNKNDFELLNEARISVDNALKRLDEFVKHHSMYAKYSQQIKQIVLELGYVRIDVDNLSNKYNHLFDDTYHNKIFALFSEILVDISSMQKLEIMQNYLWMYRKYVELKENSIVENTGIYFVLLTSKQMTDEDILLWKQLIAKDILPPFDILSDSAVVSKLTKLFPVEEFNAILSSEREMILHDAIRGKYSVSATGWLNEVHIKMKYFTQVESLLQSEIQRIEQEYYLIPSRNIMIGYGLGILLLLLLMLKLFTVYYKALHDNRISKDTLRDIELIFDKNQQQEIQRLIEEGKFEYIYKFLINAIKDANQTKDLFLASMSHEIRTPLNGILGFTELLKGTDSQEEREEFISVIEKSSANLLTIVNDILDLSKIKAQRIELEKIEFDPVNSFEAAVESYAAKAADESIDFNVFLDPQLPTLLIGDPTKISQVIVNLVSNAIKFTSKNGEVNVSIEKIFEDVDTAEVKFSVSDTGIGITKEQKENLFKAFYQADVSTSRKYGGTGLGLSISSKLIELMGGNIKIRSVENEGSTFYFTLVFKKPVTAKRREVPDKSSYTVAILNAHLDTEYYINKNLEAYIAYTGAKIKRYTDESLLALKDSSELPDMLFIDHKFRNRGDDLEKFLDLNTKIVLMSTGDQKKNLRRYTSRINKVLYKPINFTKILKTLNDKEELLESGKKLAFKNIHVLVAEDNLINQKLIKSVLNRLGIEVSLVNNGKEALEQRMKNEYDMIFMDIQMPVMGGMEATGNIVNYEKSNNKIHTPIVALTANTLEGDREVYLASGMDGYLSKPIDIEALNQLLEEYFEDRIADDNS